MQIILEYYCPAVTSRDVSLCIRKHMPFTSFLHSHRIHVNTPVSVNNRLIANAISWSLKYDELLFIWTSCLEIIAARSSHPIHYTNHINLLYDAVVFDTDDLPFR